VVGAGFRGSAARAQEDRVLDRTKEPGAIGEPLYQDVITHCAKPGSRAHQLRTSVIADATGYPARNSPRDGQGRLDELKKDKPKNTSPWHHGRRDHTSLDYDPDFNIEGADIVKASSSGSVPMNRGANKNSIRSSARKLTTTPGLLRLRLQEIRRDHHQPPALRPGRSARRISSPRPTSSQPTSSRSSRSTMCSTTRHPAGRSC